MEERQSHRFSVGAEILPKNERSEEILRQRALQEAAQAEKQALLEAAARRKREEDKKKASKQADAALAKRQLEEQRLLAMQKSEEESKRLGGRMLNILGKLQRDQTPRDLTTSGIELGTVRTRILINNIVPNTSLNCLTMCRKMVEDEVGVDLARMLMLNKHLRKLELEGNKLGPKTAREFGNLLKITKTLKFLDFENNTLTNEGDDPSGLNFFIEALKHNQTLLSLNVANNRLDENMGKAFEEALEQNFTLIDFEFGQNSFTVDTIRNLQFCLRRNKSLYDENQLREWNERRIMRTEDSQLQERYLKDESAREKKRMEEEEYDEKERQVAQEWRKKGLDYNVERNTLIQQLTEAAIIRGQRGKRKGKKRGGGKKKKK